MGSAPLSECACAEWQSHRVNGVWAQPCGQQVRLSTDGRLVTGRCVSKRWVKPRRMSQCRVDKGWQPLSYTLWPTWPTTDPNDLHLLRHLSLSCIVICSCVLFVCLETPLLNFYTAMNQQLNNIKFQNSIKKISLFTKQVPFGTQSIWRLYNSFPTDIQNVDALDLGVDHTCPPGVKTSWNKVMPTNNLIAKKAQTNKKRVNNYLFWENNLTYFFFLFSTNYSQKLETHCNLIQSLQKTQWCRQELSSPAQKKDVSVLLNCLRCWINQERIHSAQILCVGQWCQLALWAEFPRKKTYWGKANLNKKVTVLDLDFRWSVLLTDSSMCFDPSEEHMKDNRQQLISDTFVCSKTMNLEKESDGFTSSITKTVKSWIEVFGNTVKPAQQTFRKFCKRPRRKITHEYDHYSVLYWAFRWIVFFVFCNPSTIIWWNKTQKHYKNTKVCSCLTVVCLSFLHDHM